MKWYRPLHWWECGWCSLLHWEYVFWQQDDYGNAVIVQRKTLRVFNGYGGGQDD